MYDWNDLKAFLAVAETGSTLSAAQALRVSQTTVARRIAALEAATSLNLFERRQAGYALTPVGEAMLASAIAVRAPTRLRPVSRSPTVSTGTSAVSAICGNSVAASERT